jgi:DNA-binding NarL/FixJ family response regulator
LTALWLKEVPEDAALPWREFAILARALADGHDLSDIALMRDIAERTISVLAYD